MPAIPSCWGVDMTSSEWERRVDAMSPAHGVALRLRRAGYEVVELEGSYAGWSTWKARSGATRPTDLHTAAQEGAR